MLSLKYLFPTLATFSSISWRNYCVFESRFQDESKIMKKNLFNNMMKFGFNCEKKKKRKNTRCEDEMSNGKRFLGSNVVNMK